MNVLVKSTGSSQLPMIKMNIICNYIALLLLLLSRFSRVQLCATPWTVAHQTPLFMGFSR